MTLQNSTSPVLKIQENKIENASFELTLPDEATLVRQLNEIRRFQELVHANLVPDMDYGTIPGTGNKPTLLKPGAEKISKLLGLADHYEVMDQIEDWGKPFFHYKVRCLLISIRSGITISTGMGECNSYESKYRWRESKRKCPVCNSESIIKGKEEYGGGWLCFKKQGGCGATFPDNDTRIVDQKIGRVENEDIFSQVNTILKMAKKRAMIDAALSAGRLSDVFTQDMEDIAAFDKSEKKAEVKQEKPKAIKKTEVKPGEKPLPRDPDTIKTTDDLLKACFEDFKMQPTDVFKELGKSKTDIVDPALDYSILFSTKLGK